MPLVNNSNSIDVRIQAKADQAIEETRKFIAEQDRLKKEFKETQAAMTKQAQVAEQAAKKSTSSWTEFRSMYSTVLDAVKVGQAIWDETAGKFIENAVMIGNFARSLGTTTEEASRLKEVADDVGIGVDKLRASLKLAQKDGFEPNIEGLAKMSDDYLKLAPGIERTQFLLDRFGKSGEEMGKILEKGGESIREMTASMDEGLIVTEEMYQQARQLQISQDALNDSWDAFTYKAAPPLINAVTTIVNDMRDWQVANELAKEDGETLFLLSGKKYEAYIDEAAAQREAADAALLAVDASNEAGDAFESEAEKVARLKEEAAAAELQIREITKANQDYLNSIESLSGSLQNNAEKHADIQRELDEGKITLDEAKAKWKELADEQELASRRMILSMLEQQLAIDGLSAREADYLLATGLKWGVYSQEAVDAMRAAQIEVATLRGEFESLPTEKTFTYYVQTVGAVNAAMQDYYAGEKQYAQGGSFVIPPQYGYEGFNMGGMATASAGETVTITPKEQPRSWGGGVNINVTLQGVVADPEQMAFKLAPAIKRVLRSEGVLRA